MGRPLPGPGEPLWTDEDRAWALALQAEEGDECGGCGHPLEESLDPRAEEERWYVPTRFRCHACTVKEAQQKNDAGEAPGLFVGVVRR